jgi:hypothetical protein
MMMLLAREPGRTVLSHATFSWTIVTTSRCFPGSGGAGIQPATRRFRPPGTGTVSCTRRGSCHSWPVVSVSSHKSPRCTGAGSPLVSVLVDRLLMLTLTDTGCLGRTGPDDPIRLRSVTERLSSSGSRLLRPTEAALPKDPGALRSPDGNSRNRRSACLASLVDPRFGVRDLASRLPTNGTLGTALPGRPPPP